MRSPVWLPLAALLVAIPRPGAAQDTMALFRQGRALVERGDWAGACPLFEESHRLQPDAIGILLNLADCQAHTGKPASAWSNYVEAEARSKSKGDQERTQYAHAQAAALEPRLSRLRVNAAATPGLRVTRDDHEMGSGILGTSFPVDPGEHRIAATAPGYKPWSTTVRVQGDRASVSVDVPPLEKADGTVWGSQRIAGVAVGGAGILGIAAGSILGALTLKKISDSKTQGNCNGTLTVCNQAGLDMQADAKNLAHGSTAAFAVGGAAVVAGIVLVATGGRAGQPKGTGLLTVGPVAGSEMSGLLLRGRW
jgi:hypothetical protein